MRKGLSFFIVFIFLHSAFIVTCSGSVDVIDFQDLVVDGWVLDSITEGSYDDYVELWEGLGVAPSDYLMGDVDPRIIYLLIYSQSVSNSTVYVEIHIFDSEDDARTEFSFQKQWKTDSPMFKRFLYGRRIFQEGNVLLFFFSNQTAENIMIPYGRYGQTYITQVDSFITGFFKKIAPYLYQVPETPVSNFTGKYIWGIKTGDIFSWQQSRETFMGSLGTGMSHSKESTNITLEIVEFTDDESWVLIKQRHESFKVFNEYGSSIILDYPFYIHAWVPAVEGLSGEMENGLEERVFFPLYCDGMKLIDYLEDEINHLPEKNYIEGSHSLSAHGRTSSYSGFTPLKTEWRDITVHTGTGIITYYEFYYNDNEYSITTTSTLNLLNTNIDMDKREPYLPSLIIAAELSTNSVTQGETLTISVYVEDEDESYVEDVSATAVIGEYIVQLTELGGGDYKGQLETSGLQEDQYEVIVTVECTGYESAQEALIFTVEKKASGITGFPTISMVFGVIAGVLFLYKKTEI